MRKESVKIKTLAAFTAFCFAVNSIPLAAYDGIPAELVTGTNTQTKTAEEAAKSTETKNAAKESATSVQFLSEQSALSSVKPSPTEVKNLIKLYDTYMKNNYKGVGYQVEVLDAEHAKIVIADASKSTSLSTIVKSSAPLSPPAVSTMNLLVSKDSSGIITSDAIEFQSNGEDYAVTLKKTATGYQPLVTTVTVQGRLMKNIYFSDKTDFDENLRENFPEVQLANGEYFSRLVYAPDLSIMPGSEISSMNARLDANMNVRQIVLRCPADAGYPAGPDNPDSFTLENLTVDPVTKKITSISPFEEENGWIYYQLTSLSSTQYKITHTTYGGRITEKIFSIKPGEGVEDLIIYARDYMSRQADLDYALEQLEKIGFPFPENPDIDNFKPYIVDNYFVGVDIKIDSKNWVRLIFPDDYENPDSMPKVIADTNRDGKFDAADTALTQAAKEILSAVQPDILPGVNLAGEYCILSYDQAAQKVTIHQDGTIREVPISLIQAPAYQDYPVKGGDTVRVYITEKSASTTFHVYDALSGEVNIYDITARGLRGLFQVSPDGESFTVANESNLHIFTRSGGKAVLSVPELSIEGKDVDPGINIFSFNG